jgi:hypothetical protein
MDSTVHWLFTAAATGTNRQQGSPRSKRADKVKVKVTITPQNNSIHLISQRAGE